MSRFNYALKVFLLGGAATAALGVASAWAQEAAATSPTLGEVVVTAQRRSERLEDVPMTITAIQGETLENRGVNNLHDLSQAIPAAQINYGGSFTQAGLRGITSTISGFQFEGNVAVYIDGFYQANGSFLNADFANLEGVQVLKGPQGSLYGRNATGGAILLTTKSPSSDLTGSIEAKYGSFNDRSMKGFISGPITDRVRFLVAGFARKSDGYYDKIGINGLKVTDKGAPVESVSLRTKLQFDVTDDLQATLAYNFVQHNDRKASIFTPEDQRTPALPPKVGRLYDPYTVSTFNIPRFIATTHETTLTLKWTTPIGTLSSYSGHNYGMISGQFDFDGSPLGLSANAQRYHDENFQQGIDFAIDAVENLDLVVGGSYWNNKQNQRIFVGAQRTMTLTGGTGWNNEAWALFADGTYHLTDKLSLAAGGRYSKETRNIHGGYFLTIPANTVAAPSRTQNASFNNFSPRVSVRYEIVPGTNVYASWSKGFRSGQVQLLSPGFDPPVEQEKITAYEVGFKTAQSRLRFDVAAWYYDYTNLQVGAQLINPITNSVQTVTTNAAKAKNYGVEGQAEFALTENLRVTLGAAWTHGRYKEFMNAFGRGLNPVTNTNVSQTQDWSGQEMARAPEWTGVLAVDYTVPDVMNGELTASANVKYSDSYVLNNLSVFGPLVGPALANKQRFRQPSYTTINASLTWKDPSEHYKISIWGTNLTDEDIRLSQNAAPTGTYGIWGQPRQVGVTLGYEF